MIESSQNAQVKNILHLKKSAKFRKKSGLFIVEGWKMVSEAMASGYIKQLFVTQNEADTLIKQLPEAEDMVEWVSDKVFSLLSDTKTPQGILALVKMPVYCREELERKADCSFLCLENINDPGNLGTMMRTAEGAGFTGLILSKDTVDIFNPKVVRATMGSLFRIPFFIEEDFAAAMRELKEQKFTLYAAHLQGRRIYDEETYPGKLAVLIGNEANGLTDPVSELSDIILKIPMEGKLESLNAAVSAGILMYEIYKARR